MSRRSCIALDRRSVHDACLSEEDPFDLEQVPDALKAYKEKLDALQEDFRTLVECSPQAKGQVVAAANQAGPGGEKYRKFAQKYRIPLG